MENLGHLMSLHLPTCKSFALIYKLISFGPPKKFPIPAAFEPFSTLHVTVQIIF